MKILQLIYSLAPGGAERFVVDLCNDLSVDNKNQVYLVTINDDSNSVNRHYLDDLSSKVQYICLGCKKGLSLESLHKTYMVIRMIKPDIVHAHTKLIMLYLPSLLLKRSKYIHTIHTLAEKAVSFTGLKFVERYIYKRKVQPVTISSFNQKSYIKFHKQDNAVCINNGCPTKSTTNMLSDVRKEIEKLKSGKNIPVFIHVARFNEAKNQQMLFNVFNKLADEGNKYLLIVLGNGFEKTDFLIEHNVHSIKILGAKNNVGDYLACSDYFVLSSLWEGLPISLIEAMSMGVIPVCTPAGGIVDVVKDGTNGYLSPSFDKEDFYRTVIRAIENKERINKETIIDDYRQNFTMEICSKKYASLYKKLINK